MRLGIPLLAIAAMLASPRMRADELKLKDGTRIVGSIVGFEENSFKVKTSYGFAVVQKDQVASISISGDPKSAPATKADPAPATETAKPADTPKAAPTTTPPAVEPSRPADAKTSPPRTSAAVPPVPPAAQPVSPPVATKASPAEKDSSGVKPPPALPTAPPIIASPAKPETSSAATVPAVKSSDRPAAPPAESARASKIDVASPSSAKSLAAASPAPPPVPALEPIRERVNGNTYTNETYGFQMYKPPAWEVIAGVPSLLPGAIAAMGTNDQTTYLLVGQEPAGKSIEALRDATQRRLRDIMGNFRPLAETSITVSSVRATEIHFRGAVDEQDWSGVAVFLAHGARLFTIFGMTRADSDLVQIQENVIGRAISSLQFTTQK